MPNTPNLRFTRKFHNLGNAIRQGPSLADIGKNGGPADVIFAALNRAGKAMVENDFRRREKLIIDAAKTEGATEAQKTFAAEENVRLYAEDTLQGEQRNKSMKSRYFTDLDLRLTEAVNKVARDNPTDPQAFSDHVDGLIAEQRKHLPESWLTQFDGWAGKLKNTKLEQVSRTATEQSDLSNDAGLLDNFNKYSAAHANANEQFAEIKDGLAPGWGTALDEVKTSHAKALNVINSLSYRVSPAKKAGLVQKLEADGRAQSALGKFRGIMKRRGPADAEAYITALSSDTQFIIDPGERDRVVKTLRSQLDLESRVAVRAQSQSATDEILTKNQSWDEARKEARDRLTGAVRDDVVKRINQRQAEEEKSQADTSRSNRTAAFQSVEQTGSTDGLTTDMLAALKPGDQGRMERIVREKKFGTDPVTDPKLYYKLERMAGAEPSKFAGENLLSYDMSQKDRRHFAGLQQKVLSGEASDHADLTNVQTLLGLANSSLKSINVKPDSANGVEFKRSLQDRIAAEEARTGKKSDHTVWQNEIDRLLISGEVKGGWFNPDKRVYQVAPGEKFFIDGVPPKYLSEIISDLQTAGVRATADNILEAYKRAKSA